MGVVVDSLEEARQLHAPDMEALLRSVAAELAGDGPGVELVVLRTDPGQLVAELGSDGLAAVVFASNSMRHPDSAVVRALREVPDLVAGFIARGGGVMVMHQFLEGVAPIRLLPGADLRLFEKEPGPSAAVRPDVDDVLLNYPGDEVALKRGDLGPAGADRLTDPVYWLSVSSDVAELMKPVVRAHDGKALVVRSPDDWVGRVILSAVPLDWQHRVTLLANCVRFLVCGTPRWVAWSDPGQHPAMSNLAAIDPAVEFPSPGANVSWLQALGATHVFGDGKEMVEALEHGRFDASLARGGLLVALEPESTFMGGEMVTAVVGPRAESFARRFDQAMAAARAVHQPSHDPIPARNIVEADRYFHGGAPRPAARALALGTAGLVLDNPHSTLGSHIAVAVMLTTCEDAPRRLLARCAQSLKSFEHHGPASHRLQATGARLVVEAATTTLVPTAVDAWTVSVRDALDDMTPHDALRVLDLMARLPRDPRRHDLAEALVEQVRGRTGEGTNLSPEGACNFILAACDALAPATARDFLTRVVPVRNTLEQALLRSDRLPSSQVARICHALAVADRVLPMTLHSLATALSAPDRRRDVAASDVELGRLAAEVSATRDEVARLTRQLHEGRRIWLLGALLVWFSLLALTSLVAAVVHEAVTALGLAAYAVPLAATAALSVLVLTTRRMRDMGLVPPWLRRPLAWIAGKLDLAAD